MHTCNYSKTKANLTFNIFTKASHHNDGRLSNNSPKFNNSLLNLLFQLFSIKIVSFREIHYIKIAETHCFQGFYNSNIFISVIQTLSSLVALKLYHRLPYSHGQLHSLFYSLFSEVLPMVCHMLLPS